MSNFSQSNCKCLQAASKMMASHQSLIRKTCFVNISSADPSWFKIGGSNQWYLTALYKFPNLILKLTGLFFPISYVAAPTLTLGYLQGSSLTILMSITLYIYLLNPQVSRNLVLRVCIKAQLSTLVQFDSFQKYIFWQFRDWGG